MYSENLKKIRFELKMSAREFADKMNVSPGSIQNYEAAKREPNYNFMMQLCNIFSVNLNWFVTGKGEMFIKKEPAGLKDEIRQTVLEMLKNGELPK